MTSYEKEQMANKERTIFLMYCEIQDLKNALRQKDVETLAAIEERYGDTCGETQKILENYRATQVS